MFFIVQVLLALTLQATLKNECHHGQRQGIKNHS